MNDPSLGLVDWLVLVGYLIAVVVLGMWLGRGQKNVRDYFLADRSVPWWAVLLSVVATETSALTFISVPGLAYVGDFTFLQVAFGFLLGRIAVAVFLLPRYFDGELLTAYALLEQRFGPATRRFASIAFLVTRVFGDSVRLFAVAIPIGLLIGTVVSPALATPAAIVLLGIATVIYTVYGGMRAVIWTDVIQAVVLIGGGVLSLFLIGQTVAGGWPSIASAGEAAGKFRLFDLHLGFDRPHTLLAGLAGGAFLSMASHGADQLIVQRLLAAPSLAQARVALIGSGVMVTAQMALFLLVGAGLYSVYKGQAFQSSDQIFPRFILEGMPAGGAGLMVAAILAAAMSTISSSLNSLSAVSLDDLILPMRRHKSDLTLAMARRATLVWAAVLIGGALMYGDATTPAVEIALAVASFTYGALLGAFVLAIAVPSARQRHAIAAMAIGIALMIFVVLAPRLELRLIGDIAWPWYVLIGTSATVLSGLALTRLWPASDSDGSITRPARGGSAGASPNSWWRGWRGR